MNGPRYKTEGYFPLRVLIHHEDGIWWAESSALPGWTASADSYLELIEWCLLSIAELRPGEGWVAQQTEGGLTA